MKMEGSAEAFGYTDEEWLFKENLREFVDAEVAPRFMENLNEDSANIYYHDIMKKLGDMGALRAWIPEQLGGAGMRGHALAILGEEVARGCGGIAIGAIEHPLLAMRLLATPGAKEKWFDAILDGDVFFAGSTCSPEGQANYPEQADMFDFDEETQEWVINGEKAFCSGGTIADVLLISGLYKGTLHFAVMDPKNTPGLTCHHNPEFGNAPFYASYTCDNVRVPKDFGAKTNGGCVDRKAQHPAVVSRMFPIAVAAMNIGSAEAALEKTMDYLGVRTYNFKPIRNYGGVAERLVQLKIKLESARALMNTALNLIEAKDDKAIMYTAMAKGYCSDVARHITSECVQYFGTLGANIDSGISRHMADTVGFGIGVSPTSIQNASVARLLGFETDNDVHPC